MTLASLIPIALRVSIAVNVLALGTGSRVEDTTYLFRRPRELLKALVSMNVVMPVAAVIMARAFDLNPAIKIALVALSVSPVPPILPRKALKAGGQQSYTIGLLVAAALLSIVFIPAALELLQRLFGMQLGISPAAIAKLVLMTVLGPLAVGIAVRRYAPTFAARATKPLATAGAVLLLASALPIVVASFSDIRSLIGDGALAAIVAFIAIGLTAGHVLGGPNDDNRSVLALASSSRHPGIAITIAHVNFPEQRLATAAVGLYLIVNVILGIPAGRWAKRRHDSTAIAGRTS